MNKNKDFLITYNKGKNIVCNFAAVYFRFNNRPYNRLGITAGKKVGDSIRRNRAKRIIRQAYRENEVILPIGIDIVIVARSALCTVKSNVFSDWLGSECIKKIYSALKKEGRKNDGMIGK